VVDNTSHVTPVGRCEEMARPSDSPGALLVTLGEQMQSLSRRAERAEGEAASLRETLSKARTAADGLGRELEELRVSHAGLEERCGRLAAEIERGRSGVGRAEELQGRVAELEAQLGRSAVEIKVLAQRAERAARAEAEASAAIEERRVVETVLSRVASALRDALASHERAVDSVEGALRAVVERCS